MRQTSYRGFQEKRKKLARSFNFTFRYIDDVLSLNKIGLHGDFVDPIYQKWNKRLAWHVCLYSYEADFIQGLLKKNEKKLAWSFNFTFRYIDDVLSLNNSRFGDFVDRIYPTELEINDTIDTDRSASYLDLHLEFETNGWWRTKLYDKRDDFNFPIVNFPLICSNIPTAPALWSIYLSDDTIFQSLWLASAFPW